MKIHLNYKPFKCSFCGYAAREKATLCQHEKSCATKHGHSMNGSVGVVASAASLVASGLSGGLTGGLSGFTGNSLSGTGLAGIGAGGLGGSGLGSGGVSGNGVGGSGLSGLNVSGLSGNNLVGSNLSGNNLGVVGNGLTGNSLSAHLTQNINNNGMNRNNLTSNSLAGNLQLAQQLRLQQAHNQAVQNNMNNLANQMSENSTNQNNNITTSQSGSTNIFTEILRGIKTTGNNAEHSLEEHRNLERLTPNYLGVNRFTSADGSNNGEEYKHSMDLSKFMSGSLKNRISPSSLQAVELQKVLATKAMINSTARRRTSGDMKTEYLENFSPNNLPNFRDSHNLQHNQQFTVC